MNWGTAPDNLAAHTKPDCTALILAVLIAAPGAAIRANANGAQPPVANASSPGPGQTLTNAHKDPTFTEFFRRTNGWVAGDGALSVPLSDGRALWLFGDSFIDCYDPATHTIPCLFQVRNTALVHAKADVHHARTLLNTNGANRTLFQAPASTQRWFWPVSGFQQGNTVYVYLTKLKPGGGLGFEVDGHAWGKLRFPELEVAGYAELPDFNGIDFGCGFVPEADGGYTYAFGSKLDGLEGNLYVARFPTAEPEHDWAYWDGRRWSTNVREAAIVGRAAVSLNVCKFGNQYVLLSSQFSLACDQGREIYASAATRPIGPFSPRHKVFTLDDVVQGHYPFFYVPAGHPEFSNNRDGLLVTYCINGYAPAIPSCENGRMRPDHYRPKAIRVPLELITP